ncbi:hydrogenase expression/formation protein HypE [Neptunomonas antarctica]|uniref:Hydrogenase expression/formation protein HypE n=1 Tax=Neptunomonas antarctica TaxID=619304 RepID=A0A1N7L4B2_9GAMM|nr:hydrogenase expression/formation protein HypE [Neptunomonas antarctica]SIS68678.1 hydrogenase expression/formation protein HypE [Neptunomonas antarctica]
MTKEQIDINPTCPLPFSDNERILLGHGSGGQLSHQLLTELIYPYFDNPMLATGHDSALLSIGEQRLAFTTDSFVVSPLFFPGGDIGKLAVYGTVNDLAMSGAKALYLSCSLILEEGFPMNTLSKVLASMSQAAKETGIQLVTGDTKVVEKGKGDGVYINTAGIGVVPHDVYIAPQHIQQGDVIILSGDIGRHGMAVMAMREGLEFDNPLNSDCAALSDPIHTLLNEGIAIHCLRDLTRGGLATALVELAETAEKTFIVEETAIPVSEAVTGACEMLGLDPCYVANEGRFIAFIPAAQAETALTLLRDHSVSATSCIIGRVDEDNKSQVIYKTTTGSERLMQRLPGEQLPRIC